jgi:uncharacterized protein (TIGR02231 family)
MDRFNGYAVYKSSMKLLRLPLFALAALAAAPAVLPAAAITTSSQLSAATVYLDRAVLTRTARVDLPAGQSELVFERLPAGLVDQSLQVAGRGTATATILDVSARTTYVAATPSMRVKALEDELIGLQQQDRAFADRLAHLSQQRALLAKIESAMTTPPTGDAATPRPSFEDWQKLLTFQAETLARLTSEQQTVDRQRADLEAKIAAVEAQLNALRGQQPEGRAYKTVTVRVAATTAGSLDVTLGYAVPGASWAPAYDARLRGETRAVELTYYGVVRNGTGEDWNNLALTLSTARPSMGGGAPELPAWIVDVSRPMPMPLAMEMRRKEMSERQVFNQMAVASAAPMADALVEQDAGMAFSTIEAGTTSATFKIATPVTLASDNTSQKVAITSAKLPGNLQYQATPKLLEAAFLSAYVTNAGEFPFLAGPVSTFLDDTFVATSRLKTVMPGERFELALGVDDAIAVKRRLVNRFAEDTGLTNSGRRVTYEFLVTITNNKKTAERLVFKEAIPVSRDEKIVVKLLTPLERDLGTAAAPKEVSREEDGKLVWRLDLKPGEKREISLKVSIDHPADVQVVGLN